MTNYNPFNSGNYNDCCRDNYSVSYNGIMNSGHHGSYSGNKEDYSMEKFGNSESFG
jgi:hypothetical protein